jgi:molecular chaperone GrpE
MPEREKELTVLEPLEITPGGPQEVQAVEAAPAPVSGELPAARTEPVSRAEYDQLRTERDQLVDRLARLQAEFENARKRAEREKLEYRDYATGSVVEQFLPVLDNFELALKSSGTAQVNPIPTVGEPFDPRVHEALGSVDRDDLPDQHVAEEIRRGYRLRERLLRPAMVRVVHNPKQTSE